MPKAEIGSAKEVANRSKSRGLQKLKYFCQACEKQCRDENGFKCHCASDSHIQQMGVFAQNAEGFMDTYSSSFDKTFIELLSRRFGTRRIAANLVYNELIQDKTHVHMNSTMWATLTDYVTYLGRTGKAVVEETERGWFITYIDRNPEAARRAEAAARLRERNGAESARFEDEIELRAALAASNAGDPTITATTTTTTHCLDGAQKLGVNLGALAVHVRTNTLRPSALGDEEDEEEGEEEEEDDDNDIGDGGKDGMIKEEDAKTYHGGRSIAGASVGTKRSRWDSSVAGGASSVIGGGGGGGGGSGPTTSSRAAAASNLASIIEEERSAKSKRIFVATQAAAAVVAAPVVVAPITRRDDWLLPGIIVKVMDARIGGGIYLRAKGIVTAVENTYGARLQMIDTDDILLVDAADLETVVPKEGGKVKMLAGIYRGALGEVICLRIDAFCADIRLFDGGMILEKIAYEDFTKAV